MEWIGVFVNETVIAEVGCGGKIIIDFTTSSPAGMSKTTIRNTSPGRLGQGKTVVHVCSS